MISTKEAAQRLGLKTTGAVRQLILAGRLKAEKRGRDWWVDEESVRQFQTERRPPGRPSKSKLEVDSSHIAHKIAQSDPLHTEASEDIPH